MTPRSMALRSNSSESCLGRGLPNAETQPHASLTVPTALLVRADEVFQNCVGAQGGLEDTV